MFLKFKNVLWDNSRIFSEETTFVRLWIGFPGSLNLVLNQYSKLGISCSFNWFSSHNIFCKLGLGSGHCTHSNILETFTTSCTIQEGPHPVQYKRDHILYNTRGTTSCTIQEGSHPVQYKRDHILYSTVRQIRGTTSCTIQEGPHPVQYS